MRTKKIFKQLDSRWSDLAYPTKSSSFGGNGCGCCACTHIAIEQEAKKDWTPKTLRKWMVAQGFAEAGHGTTWNGITETLKHIGHKNVVRIWNDPMSKAWKELDKGDRIGVLLVDNSKTPDGTYWTASGHYVAFTDYRKTKNGNHWFYIKDSGGRNHDGWYCYEKSIAGALPKMWIVERIKSPQEKICDKAKEIADSHKYKYKFYSEKYGKECAICHPHGGQNKGWNCIGFAFASWHHSGIPCKCSCDVMTDQLYNKILKVSLKEAKRIVSERTGLPIEDIRIKRRGGRAVPQSELKPGDIVVYYTSKGYVHTALWVGNGKIADCTSGRKQQIKYGVKAYKSMTIKFAIRYKGK